jgi:hypothetical protein
MNPAYSGRALVLVLLAGALTAGCLPHGYGAHRTSDRAVVRTPPPPPRSAPLYNRTDRDANAYARQLARPLRLSPMQQRQVRDVVSRRTFELLDRTRSRDHHQVYPFPRRANDRSRAVQRYWRDTDRAIERVLAPEQRRAYRNYVRYHYDHDRRRRGR